MWKFKASKYKNAAPKVLKKEEWISDLPVGGGLQSCGTHVKASAKWMAFNVDSAGGGNLGVLPLETAGRQRKGLPVVQAHAEFVTDFDFNPFDDGIIASGSNDCAVKLWRIPDSGLSESLCNPESVVSQEQRRVERVLWHPAAENVLAVAAFKTLNVYDVNTKQVIASLPVHGDQIQSISWRSNGSSMVTSAKDKIIRVFDPRSHQKPLEAPGHENIKDSSVVWVGNKDQILSTGFDRMRTRQMALRDIRNLSSPLKTLEVDNSTGVFMPFYDEDTDMLFVAGKGDTSIRFMEITDKEPFFTQGNIDMTEQIAGLGNVPKRALDVMTCEVNRLLLMTKNAIIPMSYRVPRKSYQEFHGDLYPEAFAGIHSMTAAQWAGGENKPVVRMSLDPSQRKCPGGGHCPPWQASSSAKPAAAAATPQAKASPSPSPVASITSKMADSNISSGSLQNGAKQSPSPKPAPSPKPSPKPKALQGFHQSKCRHLKGVPAKRQDHIENIRNICKSVPGESDMFHANPERCAVPLGGPGGLIQILELSQKGKLPDTGLPAIQNGSMLMDFIWDPFNHHQLAACCEDAKIRVWQIPEGGLTETLTEPEIYLRGHTEKIYCLAYHPLARHVLASCSYDMSVRIWDTSTGEEHVCLSGHEDTIFCMAWSPCGKKLATVCKDGKIRIYEPRKSTEPIMEGSGPPGSRGARCVWVCGGQRLAVTGFDRQSTRTVQVYDPATLSGVLSSMDLQISPSILVPFYDEDTSTLFLTARGDSLVYTFEVLPDEPYLFQLANHSTTTLHQGLSFLPKNQCDVRKVEFAKALRLTSNSVEPVSFIVPRVKLDYFQEDIFPETQVTWQPVLSAAEWFAGVNRLPKRIPLKPADMKNLSEAPVEAPKPKKFESFNADTYKSDEEKKEELISAMVNKVGKKDDPLPQDLTEGVDEDEWDD